MYDECFGLCLSLPTTCVQCPQQSEEGGVSPETVVTDAFELPCKDWESNQGPLEEQLVLLTTDSSL